jgi:hypothetical protein
MLCAKVVSATSTASNDNSDRRIKRIRVMGNEENS